MKDPNAPALVVAAELMGEWTEAAVAAEAAGLAALKAEMQGLAVLFGGTSEPLERAEAQAREARIEEGFDNMPL